MNDLKESVIFPKGEKITNDYFYGEAWVKMLIQSDSASNCPTYNVTFAPGARNSWHKHPGGQILLITGGRGYYQEWGQKAKELHPGDVVEIPANAKHWHGAAPDSWFVHIGITANIQMGDAQWMEPVSDEDYNKLK